jgi:flagellar biosynthesis protein FlhG
VLLAADHPASVTHAYASMKLLVQRNALMAFDLLLAAPAHSPRRERIAEQLAGCADRFLQAVLHAWAAVDPACDAADAPPRALVQIARELLDGSDEPAVEPAWPSGPVRSAVPAAPAAWAASRAAAN